MQRRLKLFQVDLKLPLAFQPLEWWAGLSKGKKGKRGKREKWKKIKKKRKEEK